MTEPAISNHMSIIGSLGGKTKGERKKRSSEHYRRIQALSVAKRWAKKGVK